MKTMKSFNSNMVRLKDNFKFNQDNGTYLFQFQYGSIKSYYASHPDLLNAGFNSNMVRLKENIKISFSGRQQVSIPIWFD